MSPKSLRRSARASLPAIAMAAVVGVSGCGGSPSSPSAQSGPSPSVAGPAPSSAVATSRPSAALAAPSPAAVSPTVAAVARLSAIVAANPKDGDAQRQLGSALAQRVRETADPSLYALALVAFQAALAVEPADAEALTGVAGIQLGKHQFGDALRTARRAIDLSPSLVPARAAEVDALVELGRYGAADAAAAEMLGIRTDISTLSRASYLAELRGHLPAALGAMRQAAADPAPAPENSAYVRALLGNLLVWSGDRAGAAKAYADALALVPSHAPSLAGQGRLAVGEGRLDDAIELFRHASAVVPLPEYVIAQGDAERAAGRLDDARRSDDLARAEIRLFRAAGVVVDVDLALFEADRGDASDALAHARAGYAATPTVRAADAVAWALHRLGRDTEAEPYVVKALRLGSIDPILRYHAGAIEAANGDRTNARHDLELALRIDPGFSATGAAEARRLLSTLEG
ncbi:MAG TPA: hypothetical protein VH440_03205 [Candidatus Limnocylindrales bacterium]